MRAANHKTYCTDWDANVRPSERQANALIVRPLRVLSINDIVIPSNILWFVLFADDTTVYVQHDSIDGAIQSLTRN